MKKISLGANGPQVGRIGLGLMGMSAFYTGKGEDDAESIRTIHRAIELGVTLLDTAEIYGPYLNEELLAQAIAGRRDEVVIATKFGTLRHRTDNSYGPDGSPENMRISVEGSLKRLGTDHIDLYYQHRMDPGVPIEDTVGEFVKLIDEGKILGYGLSEAAPATIRRAHAVHPVTALQSSTPCGPAIPRRTSCPPCASSASVRALFASRTWFPHRDHPFTRPVRRGGLPSQQPSLLGREPGNQHRDCRAGGRNRCRRGRHAGPVALAWLLAQGDDIVPIPGTKRVPYLEENVAADEVSLTPAQLAALGSLSAPVGDRYADMTPLGR